MKKLLYLLPVLIIMLSGVAIPAYGAWNTSFSKDEMTGKRSAYATSTYTAPTSRMGFPYSDTEAWIGVGCAGTSEWVYVGFNNAPNLLNTVTKDGYNQIRTRIKWDDKVEDVTLTQDWGAKFIHFGNDTSIISKIATSNSMLLELNWHGQGKTYFKFSLSGSSAAIKRIRNKCAKYTK